MRRCDGCGTRLGGRKFHGHVRDDGALVCGRSEQQRTVTTHRLTDSGRMEPVRVLDFVETPECAA